MDKQGKKEWKWKSWAIGVITDLFVQNVPSIISEETIMVPIPPSKKRGDPLYDDRLTQVLTSFCSASSVAELREIIGLSENMIPTHESKSTPGEILSHLTIDNNLCVNKKGSIILVDDVLTEGAHFKACQRALQVGFPHSKIKGLFIARTQH